jgi:hypothetical protein
MTVSGVAAPKAVMYSINPLSGALAQSSQLQLQQAAEKSRQARQAQEKARNVAVREEDTDETEHPIENSEELSAIHDEGRQSREQGKKKHKPEEADLAEDQNDGLDLTA